MFFLQLKILFLVWLVSSWEVSDLTLDMHSAALASAVSIAKRAKVRAMHSPIKAEACFINRIASGRSSRWLRTEALAVMLSIPVLRSGRLPSRKRRCRSMNPWTASSVAKTFGRPFSSDIPPYTPSCKIINRTKKKKKYVRNKLF